ncbi:unnamed protein product [Bathycoccus prasinos]
MKTSEDQVIKPSVVIRFDVVYPHFQHKSSWSSGTAAGDIQSEILEKFQDITVLEMRKKLGAIQTQYLEKQLEMYRENKDMFNRKHALKNMRIRGLPPRPSTILKYNITDEEIADCCKRV